jgi:hypothetical protein
VLPSLSLAVTEDSVRKKKRIVMFVPGLVAFAVYRLVKLLLPLSEPIVLLMVSGLVSLVTALLAYRVGRATPWSRIVREDGNRLLCWLGGWIGFVYGVQLSLLVLALLWLVGYDYLKHPDGPAMMAIIISCTSVARDAFEIGHVRKIALMGRPFPTFPDGTCPLGCDGARRRRTGRVAGPARRGTSGRGHCPAGGGGPVGGWGRALCLLRRASPASIMDARASTDQGGRIAQILVVAWAFLCRDLLSGCCGMCDLPLEATGNTDSLCNGCRRICDWYDGTLLLLSWVSPASRRATGADDVKCVT